LVQEPLLSMKTPFRLLFAAVVGLLALAGGAQAGPIWELQWRFGTNILISDSGRSFVSFTPDGPTYSSKKNASAEVADIGVASFVPPWMTDRITRQNYGMLLKLTDLASHASRYFWFSGSLSGQLSQHWTNLTNRFLTPTYYGNIHLGKEIYNIHIGPFIAPSWNNHFNGRILAYVDPIPVDPHPSGSPQGTPEPSTLILGGLGLVLGVPFWRRRRGIGASK
jgi:hypothetical protein